MKKLTLFLLMLAFSTSTIFAQHKKTGMIDLVKDNKISVEKRSMSQGQKVAYSVMLASADKKEMEKAWSKYMKDYKGKTKKNKKTNEYMTDNAKIETMSDNTVDVYSQLQELGNETQLVVWFDLGGAFVSPEGHPQASMTAQNLLSTFAHSIDKKNIAVQLKVEQKSLKNVEDELKKNEKELKNLEKDIENYKKKITEAEEKIVKNKEKQEEIKGRLATQKDKVGTVETKLKKM